MAFFKGQETYSLDNKGRVSIPMKMRKQISPDAEDAFIVTRGFEKCVYAYPKDEWQTYEERYRRKDQFNKEHRYFLRTLLMWSEDVKLDSQKRISLPKELVKYANIEGKVRIVGNVDHIEFWDPDEFDKYLAGHEESYEEVAAKVMAEPDDAEE